LAGGVVSDFHIGLLLGGGLALAGQVAGQIGLWIARKAAS
jgi:hypothetical protein